MKNSEKYLGANGQLRLFNSMRNTYWNFIGQIIFVFGGLFLKRALLHTLGLERIGLNYLFNDIVALLSMAELGITGIIAYQLYEPLAKGNHIKVKQIMDFFRKAYFILGFTVLLVGIGIIPFLKYIVGESDLSFIYIATVFILFLIRSAEGYFLSYKQLLLYADQKNYIVAIIDIIVTIIYMIIVIVVLWYTKSFIYVIVLEIIKKVINDLIIIKIVNKRYPYIIKENVSPIDKKSVKTIINNVKDTFISSISKEIINATDNIVISAYLGIGITGLFSNYAMVIKTIETVLKQLIKSVQASIGNLLVEEKGSVIYSVLKKITFISFFMVSVSGCCLVLLVTPFVSIWFGATYTMIESIVLICVFNIFIYILQLGVIQYADAGGLFKNTKKIDLMGAIINVCLSVAGVQFIGIIGVFVATLIARIFEFYFRIRLVFRDILKIEYSGYILQTIGYTSVFIFEITVLKLITSMIYFENSIVEFLVYAMIAVILPCIVNIFIYYSSEEYKYMKYILKVFIYKK